MNKTRSILAVAVFVIIALSVVHVGMSNRIATDGVRLSRIQQEVNKYKKENALLQEKVLEAGSLTRISKQASDQGFSPAKDKLFIQDSPLAIKP